MTEQLLEGIKVGAEELMCGIARDRSWKAATEIAALIMPGMTETEAIRAANGVLASHGVRKFWHKTHVRFGSSTVLSFDDPYESNVVLQEDDIFYVDIGPIWDGIEGDVGLTVATGTDPRKRAIARDAKVLFEAVRDHWKSAKAIGQELLTFAERRAKEMGYLLHPAYVKGHRLSEFPHQFYAKGATLFGQKETPASKRWVLEIHICDLEMKYGAFYEDILM